MAQSSITKFFRPKPGSPKKVARQSLDENRSPNMEDEAVTPTKRHKPEIDTEEGPSKGGGLTPGRIKWLLTSSFVEIDSSLRIVQDQKRRASENQLRAKIKLTSRQLEGALHPNVGTTWFAALECEFKKVEEWFAMKKKPPFVVALYVPLWLLLQDYFAKLSVFLTAERAAHPNKIYPPQDQVRNFIWCFHPLPAVRPCIIFQKVWSWTHHFDVKDTKVVILGQDPYHGPGQAHGLCFSVQKGIPCPPSLVNMYKELSNDIEGFTPPQHGFLEGWSKQGVLLVWPVGFPYNLMCATDLFLFT